MTETRPNKSQHWTRERVEFAIWRTTYSLGGDPTYLIRLRLPNGRVHHSTHPTLELARERRAEVCEKWGRPNGPAPKTPDLRVAWREKERKRALAKIILQQSIWEAQNAS